MSLSNPSILFMDYLISFTHKKKKSVSIAFTLWSMTIAHAITMMRLDGRLSSKCVIISDDWLVGIWSWFVTNRMAVLIWLKFICCAITQTQRRGLYESFGCIWLHCNICKNGKYRQRTSVCTLIHRRFFFSFVRSSLSVTATATTVVIIVKKNVHSRVTFFLKKNFNATYFHSIPLCNFIWFVCCCCCFFFSTFFLCTEKWMSHCAIWLLVCVFIIIFFSFPFICFFSNFS